MGYLPVHLSAEGTEVAVEIRGRPHAARVVGLPFYRRPRANAPQSRTRK
jgi:aminomethyltransferase